jgi:hypothetical protein
MSMKTIIVILGAVVLTAATVIAARNIGRLTSYQLHDSSQGNSREVVPTNKKLEWYARQTKAKGENAITLSAPFIDYPGNSMSTHIDEAMSAFSTLIVEPIKQEVVATEDGDILTWYKFETIESLSEHNPYPCAECPTPPVDFYPIKDNEFAMATYGGTVTIDGVNLTMVDPTFPQLKLRKRYLLFISRGASGIATIGVGPNGVFEVGPNGSLTPINRNPHSIKDDITRRFGKSLSKVREHARCVPK